MSVRSLALLERGDPRDRDSWHARLSLDRPEAERRMSSEQRRVTSRLLTRAAELTVGGLALTGSTARGTRTAISDLDYHVVGRRPSVHDLPADVDVYAADEARTREKLIAGDDFVQWTLRYGLILQDSGAFRRAAALVVERDIWPDGAAKLRRIAELHQLAARLIAMGDRDAAHDQVRATLTSAARGLLLIHEVFPLARSELPDQLRSTGLEALADGLEREIHEIPDLQELTADLQLVTEDRLSALR